MSSVTDKHQVLFYSYSTENEGAGVGVAPKIAAFNISVKKNAAVAEDIKRAKAGLTEANKICEYIRAVELDNLAINKFFDIEEIEKFEDFTKENQDFVHECTNVPVGKENDFLLERDSVYVKQIKMINNFSNLEASDSEVILTLEVEFDVYESIVDELEAYFHYRNNFVLKM